MGTFLYGGGASQSVELDDRTLAHLELAISTKLRRGESFAFTLGPHDISGEIGHRVFWMHPTICVQFRFDRDWHRVRINTNWVRDMVLAASTEAGLRVVPEPTSADDSR